MPRRLVLAWLLVCGAACAERHEGRGLVVKVDRSSATITVSHDEMPGYMPAMVMRFTVSEAAALENVQPGDRIGFRLNVSRGYTSLDRVRILSAAPAGSAVAPAVSAPLVPIGGAMPDFTLLDQDGQIVSLGRHRGKVILVTFIYSRCPLPDYCPRIMTNVGAIRDRFATRLGSDLLLLTITFDPKHDSSATLKAYGDRYGANVAGWRLLTGRPDEIARVCASFGVESWPEEGMLTHTVQAAVIDRAGSLAARAEGKDFSARQLGDLVESVLER